MKGGEKTLILLDKTPTPGGNARLK